ncbi:maestro heat-like repeat-containing protein family member 6 isoform X2 [Chiroxiphia lanceolata]|uniref:maestro heat-like repeat-containing protein family member 6 isoform X2 n=1 Tax=Chiroxiphia lanceolata TaxID=296741 RepID=UPI0013CF3BE1|nr:maestro heat-like repeat-containing protein family member 6 isoform X2 [Chiroxiphia lanceolata]
MVGRRLSLLRPFRKKKEGPRTTRAQQPEEVEPFQPLQEDPGQNRTQEQDCVRGRIHRADQRVRKSMGIQRRKTRTSPTKVMAQPDPTPTELKAHPDVGTASIDGTANCDMAVTDYLTNSNTALPELTIEADRAGTEGIADDDSIPVEYLPDAPSLDALWERVLSAQVAMDPDRETERRPPRVPKLAWVKKGEEESPGAAPALQPKKVEQFQTLQEDPGQHRTKEQDRACGHFRSADQSLQKSMGIRHRKTRASSTEVMAKPDPSPTELKARADAPGTEGIADADSTPVQRLPDAPSLHVLWERVVSVEETMKADRDMARRPPRVPKLAWVKKGEDESPGAASALQPKKVEQFQPLQEDPGRHQTKEQDRARGRIRSADQRVRNSVPVRCRKARASSTEVLAQPEPNLTKLKAKADAPETEGIPDSDSTPIQLLPDAPNMDFSGDRVISAQVPALVRYIHRWLTSNVSAGHVLDNTLLALTEAHPMDVAITLLRCAPSCDRAAATMWRTIASSGTTLGKVLPTLLRVMEDWPWHSTSTSDGDNTAIFALAATLALWMILQEPQCPGPLMDYSPHLLVALLFQIFISTEQMSEEVDTFWRGCQEQHELPTDPNRFAVLTVKALLRCLHCEDVVNSVENNHGWARLLNARSRRYAAALLAREMRRVSSPLCSRITLHLLELLRREEPCWDLPAMAFLVEVLDCLDTRECGDRVLEILSRNLGSTNKKWRQLALRVLVSLSQDSEMAKSIWRLNESLVQLLGDADRDVVWMTLSLLDNVLWSSLWTQLQKRVHSEDPLISTPTGLQLAEALRPLFDHYDSSVREGSIVIFTLLMKLMERVGKRPLKPHVCLSLLPLYFHRYDENLVVKKASQKALLAVTRFLKRRDLGRLVNTEEPWKFGECLLKRDQSQVAKYVHQALPYLQSPQQPLREAAIKFMGIAGGYLKGQHKELQLIIDALQAVRDDRSPAVSNLALENINFVRAVQRAKAPPSRFQQLQDQLCRAWNSLPSLWGCVCCSCVES